MLHRLLNQGLILRRSPMLRGTKGVSNQFFLHHLPEDEIIGSISIVCS